MRCRPRRRAFGGAFFSFESNQAHAKAYFAAVTELIERNKQKERINTRTAQKFLVLWQKNNAKNRDVLQTCSGVKKFFGTDNRPALVIAAGPTLDDAIDFIQRAKTHKTHTLICVDTALRTLLRHGIEPDFILVADAQYWNYCHLNGLESKSSVLVAEVSAYPPVMRFACRETAVFDSAHPQKSKTDTQDWAAEKGTLGAGGTVASSAWDFARMLGATRIVLAGMDLSFPHKLTHARGSLFEERAHANANRMAPVETHSVSALFGAPSSYVQDNAGHIVLSDIRMDLYAWWFESQAEKYPNVKTVALSMHSRKIPGIAVGE
ncbi:MAG: hypothetical protein Ta2A_20410 [Treponemataceae bacterium]|nr:MAG: hypothetical protein Ta2A_20410 [Treponemataceae bacterium]